MSDFLTNLVARNLEQATEIKPRLASLYEPPQPVGGILYGPASDPLIGPLLPYEKDLDETVETSNKDSLTPAEHALTERRRRTQSLESNDATRQIKSRRQRHDASDASTSDLSLESAQQPSSFISPASAERETNWSTNQHTQTPAKPPSHEPSSQTVSPPIVTALQKDEPPRSAFEKSKLIPATAQDDAHTGPVIRPSVVDEKGASRPRVREIEAEHSINRDESDASDRRSVGRETRTALTRPLTQHLPSQDVSERGETQTPAGVFIRPQVTRKSELDQPAHVAAEEPLTAQTINVTIGRIEVRATTSSEARPRPQQKQTPTTSLDDYLRQRAQGVKR